MMQKILSYIRSNIPQLSEIPIGTGKMAVLAIAGAVVVPSSIIACCRTSYLSSKQKANAILLIGKIAHIASVILCLGYGLHFHSAAALALKGARVSAALQNGYVGTLIFLFGLHIKTLTKDLPANLAEKLEPIANAIYLDRSDQYYAALDEIGLGVVVPVQQLLDKMSGENPIDVFFRYLQGHDIEKAVALFPSIFDHSSIWAQRDRHADFKSLLKALKPEHQKILDYLKKKYEVPFPTLESLHQFFSRFTKVEINIEGDSFGENLFKKYHQKLLDAKKMYSESMEKHLAQFNPPERIFVGEALDSLGITAEEYNSHFISRQSLIQRLSERGVFCLGELIGKNIMARGDNEKKAVISRITLFLRGTPLKAAIPQTAPAKGTQIWTPLFNVALTGATLAIQMYAAPLLTGLGAAYGFIMRDGAINPLRPYLCQPSAQKGRATVERLFQTLFALDTTTRLGKACSFMVGVNQGETLRKNFEQVFYG